MDKFFAQIKKKPPDEDASPQAQAAKSDAASKETPKGVVLGKDGKP